MLHQIIFIINSKVYMYEKNVAYEQMKKVYQIKIRIYYLKHKNFINLSNSIHCIRVVA